MSYGENHFNIRGRNSGNANKGILSSEVSKLLIELGELNNPDRILELTSASNDLQSHFKNKTCLSYSKLSGNYEANIINKIDSMKLDSLTFNLIYCMPPLGQRIEINNRVERSEIYYMENSLSLLTDNGVLLFICPNNFLTSNFHSDIRSKIMVNYDLEMIVELPEFSLSNTGTELFLLVIKNKNSNKKDRVLMFDSIKNYKTIVDCYLKFNGDLLIDKTRMSNRWDPHFFNPKYEEINEQLKGKSVQRIEELALVIRGSHIHSERRKQEGKFLILNSRHLRNGKKIEIHERSFYVDELSTSREKQAILQPEDIVIQLQQNKLLYTVTEEDPPTIASTNFAIIRSKNNEYIKSYLNTEDGKRLFRLQIERKSRGGVLSAITFRDLSLIKIPIIPIENINKLSDKYIKESSDKEELEALKSQLNIVKKELEFQIKLNKQMENHNEQLEQQYSFLMNRFDAVDLQLNNLAYKMDKLLEHLQNLQKEFSVIKTLPTSEEQIISFLEMKVDEMIVQLTKDSFEQYINIVKSWINPNWGKLDPLSKEFLPSAEMLYVELNKIENVDPAPFIIQYCRSLENELLEKIFRPYLRDLKKRKIKIQEEFSRDLKLNDNGNPTNRNRSSYEFAKLLLRLQNKDETEWFFELGRMSIILNKLTGRSVDKSPLLRDFKQFILRFFDEEFINSKYYEEIKSLTREYRNKAAHPNSINKEEADQGRDKIIEILKLFTSFYNN